MRLNKEDSLGSSFARRGSADTTWRVVAGMGVLVDSLTAVMRSKVALI